MKKAVGVRVGALFVNDSLYTAKRNFIYDLDHHSIEGHLLRVLRHTARARLEGVMRATVAPAQLPSGYADSILLIVGL